MSATIEGISVIFGGDTAPLATAAAAADSALASVGATADIVGASLAGMGDRAVASGVGMDSLSTAATADGEAFMSLSSVMAELNSLMTEQQLAVDSDGASMATLGSVMAELDAFAAQTAASMQAEGDAAAYLAMMGDAAAPALTKTAEASAAASAALDTTAASAKAAAVSADTAAVSMETLKKAAMGIGLATLAVGALGLASVKMAGDFESSTTTLVTGAGEWAKNLDTDRAGILQLATSTGTATSQLVAGMFMINSSGQKGAQALLTLQMAAEAAKVGNADLGTVAKGVTAIMTDYASSNVTAAQAANTLIATVSNGETTMQDLSASLSSVLPVASSVKVGLKDVMGAMATMTMETVPAADAATYLRQMLITLAAPSKAGATALKEIGLSAQQVSDDMKKSLPDTLAMIEDHLKKKFPEGSIAYQDALKAIAGGSKQMQGFLDLTGSHLVAFGQNVDSISAAVKAGGANIAGWSTTQKDFNFKIDQAKSTLEVLGITIGSKVLPTLGPLISNISNGVSSFTAWVNSGHAMTDALSLTGKYSQIALPILAGLATLVGAILVPVFWSWAAATIAATWPILAVVAAVMAVVGIFVLLYQRVAPFRAFIDNLVSGFKQVASYVQANFIPAMQAIGTWFNANVMPILKQVGSFLGGVFLAAWQGLVSFWNNQLLPIAKIVIGWFQNNTMPILKTIGNFLTSTFTPLWKQLVDVWNSQLMPAFAAVGQIIQNQLWPVLQQLWSVVQNQVWPALKQLWPVLEVIGGIIGGIVVVAFVMLMGVISGLVRAIATLIGGIVKFVGGVIQFFAGLWQTVSGIVALIVDLCTGHFNKLGADLKQIWSGIQNMWSGLWAAASGLVQVFVGTIVSYVQGFFSTVVGIFTNLYNAIVGHSIIPDLINGVINWFTQLPGRVGSTVVNMVSAVTGKLSSLLSSGLTWAGNFVTGIFNSLGKLAGQAGSAIQTAINKIMSLLSGALGQAATAGLNIVKAIANGIIGAIGSFLGNAMSQVGNFIQSHLPHSPAKQGPLVTLAQSGANIPAQIAEGMLSNKGAIQTSMAMLLSPVVSSTVANSALLGSSQPVVVNAGGNNSNANRPVNVYIDGSFVGATMTDHMGNAMLSNIRSIGHPVGATF